MESIIIIFIILAVIINIATAAGRAVNKQKGSSGNRNYSKYNTASSDQLNNELWNIQNQQMQLQIQEQNRLFQEQMDRDVQEHNRIAQEHNNQFQEQQHHFMEQHNNFVNDNFFNPFTGGGFGSF